MTFRLPSTPRLPRAPLRAPPLRPLLTAGLLTCVLTQPLTAADPDLTGQPVSGVAGLGEPFGFSVTAAGTPPLGFQWFRNNELLSGATNLFLDLVSVTNADAASYSVIVTNAVGSITSAPVTLTIVTPPRTITTGTVLGGSSATVPILLSANGRENRLAFTLGFDTNVFTNPSFMPGVSGSATFDTSRAGEGLVSAAVNLPEGEIFPPGRSPAAYLQFDFVTGTNPLAGGLYFTNASVTATNLAFTTNGTALAVNAVVSPLFETLAAAPALNRQSGLFEHRLRVGYPGAGTLENVDVLIPDLGNDSLTNRIRVFNSMGIKTVGPDAEGFFANAPFFSIGALAGGETRDITAEFHVSDHVTVPDPEYRLLVEPGTGFSVPAAATPLNITTNRYVNDSFIIQWPSRSTYQYYIQYAPTLDDLVNATTNARVVNPSVRGTGHAVQWIDNGPPKTESPPVNGSRFYRVLELPVE